MSRGAAPCPLFDVLDLLAKLFDFHFDFDRGLADTDAKLIQAGGFGQDRCDLTVHFLKNEVHAFARLILEVFESGELVEMTAQSRRFLCDIASFGVKEGFGFETMSAVGDELRRQLCDPGDELLAVMFDKAFGMTQN